MYETYWNLNGKPFLQRSEPARFYRSKSHQAALLRLTYGLDNLSGPAGNYDFRAVWVNNRRADLMRVNVCQASRIAITNRGMVAQ